MTNLAQRMEQLRTAKNVSRTELALSLGFPKNAVEKFETGRQTPSREQQEKLADFFGVSLAYLRCESDDPERQETWMDLAYTEETPQPTPARPIQKPRAERSAPPPEGSGLFDALLNSKSFREQMQQAVLDALRSPEGQKLLTQAVRKELGRR